MASVFPLLPAEPGPHDATPAIVGAPSAEELEAKELDAARLEAIDVLLETEAPA